jgi:hypothetical protein
MSVPPPYEDPRRARPIGDPGTTRPRLQVDAGRLWTGGVATAGVAALVAVVGVLVARGLFDVPLLAPTGEGAWGDASTARLAGSAAAAALVATGLMHLLLLGTPRPGRFFTWFVVLATLIAVLLPFLTGAELSAKVATAVLNAVLGAAIGSLVSGVARSAVRVARA